MSSLKLVFVALALATAASSVCAGDNLLVQRVQQEQSMSLPAKGMSMVEVERRFGPPTQKLASRGGGSSKQPVINRWMYPGYIVYFERSRVIHAVLNTPAGNNTNPSNPR